MEEDDGMRACFCCLKSRSWRDAPRGPEARSSSGAILERSDQRLSFSALRTQHSALSTFFRAERSALCASKEIKMGWWRRKGFSGDEKKSILETIEKAEEEASQECVRLVVVGVVAEGLDKTKMDMVHALYQSAIDAGENGEEALKNALEKWEKIWTKAKEQLKAKGMDYKK